MQTISKHIGEGFGKGELYAALAYNSSDGFGGMAVKQVRFNPTASTTAITIGVSGTAITLAAAAQRAILINTTCALTTNVALKSVEIAQIHTGESSGNNIEVFKAQLTSDVKTGTWVNAIFGRVNYTENGYAYGSASAVCGEVSLAPGGSHSGQGTYSVFQGELDVPASAVGIGAECSFIRLSAWGDQVGLFDDDGFLLSITGVTSGAAHVFYDKGSAITGDIVGWFKVKTPSGTQYLPLYDSLS